jgi:hypothetical protein
MERVYIKRTCGSAKKSIVPVWLGSVPLLGYGPNHLVLDITRTNSLVHTTSGSQCFGYTKFRQNLAIIERSWWSCTMQFTDRFRPQLQM